jgi:N-ethylmaleimide reductase
MTNLDLFTALSLGFCTLTNRIVMAPLTRMRAGEDNVPTSINATYYDQRSSTD